MDLSVLLQYCQFNVLKVLNGMELLVLRLEVLLALEDQTGMVQHVSQHLFTVLQDHLGTGMHALLQSLNALQEQHGMELYVIQHQTHAHQVISGTVISVSILEYQSTHVFQDISGTDFVASEEVTFKSAQLVLSGMVFLVL